MINEVKTILKEKKHRGKKKKKKTLWLYIPEFLSTGHRLNHSLKDARYQQGQLDSEHLVLVGQCSGREIN
jgi:hypothetical protein